MAGEADKLKGNVKEKVGAATGNDHLEGEGKGDRASGGIKDAVQGTKDKLAGAAYAVKDKVSGHHDAKH